MRSFLVVSGLVVCVACGNSTGSGTANASDTSDNDSQLTGTDAADQDVTADTVAGTDATPGADATPGTDAASGTDATSSTDIAVADTAPDADTPPDTSPADTQPDIPATTCMPSYTGSLPGAELDLSATPCTFSISAAKGVFQLPYKLNITTSSNVSYGTNMGSCPPSAGDIHGGFATFNQVEGFVSGQMQKWCLCDTGLCAPIEPPPAPTTPGSYDVAFNWDGNNWYGPSDTGNKPGPAFPPGQYTFSVTVSGKQAMSDGTVVPFSAVAKLPITLTP